MKVCSTCEELKSIDSYHADRSKKDGRSGRCKSCVKKYRREYYQKNKERLKKCSREWHHNNKDLVKEQSRKYYIDNIDKFKKYRKEQYWKDPEGNSRKSNEYHLSRIKTDVFYRFQTRCRTRVYQALVGNGYSKNTRAYKLIGCSKEELEGHISSMFEPGMSWDNYGEWHVDHIIPFSSATSKEEVELLCHYLNMRPMWASDNISKGATFCDQEKKEKLMQIRMAIEHSSSTSAP